MNEELRRRIKNFAEADYPRVGEHISLIECLKTRLKLLKRTLSNSVYLKITNQRCIVALSFEKKSITAIIYTIVLFYRVI